MLPHLTLCHKMFGVVNGNVNRKIFSRLKGSGASRFLRDIETMIGPRGSLWHLFFTVFWKYLSPATLLFLLLFNWVQYKPLSVGEYIYPHWANTAGWCLAGAPILAVPVLAVCRIINAPKDLSLKERILHLLKPAPEWGPAHKVSEMTHMRGAHVMESIHSRDERLKQSSFDNPSFTISNVVYTFDDDT